jgi:hypothetical protein
MFFQHGFTERGTFDAVALRVERGLTVLEMNIIKVCRFLS